MLGSGGYYQPTTNYNSLTYGRSPSTSPTIRPFVLTRSVSYMRRVRRLAAGGRAHARIWKTMPKLVGDCSRESFLLRMR
eukprot:6095621-Pleurochrysis_carterae.AAC.5